MRKILFVFFFIGLSLLIGAGFLTEKNYTFIQQSVNRPGEVIGLERSRSSDSTVYHPIVRFTTADNQTVEFRSDVGSNPPSYRVGDRVEVLYLADRPGEAKINGFMSLWLLEIILSGIGLTFFLVGAIPLYVMRSNKKRRKRLVETGERILARFDHVDLNRSYKSNNRHPYRIVCQWRDPFEPSKLYLFYSENIWFNPENHINQKEITVFIDRKNPKNYHMDISFLPEIA